VCRAARAAAVRRRSRPICAWGAFGSDYGRIGAAAGLIVRRRRPQAVVWAREPLRADRLRVVARSNWPLAKDVTDAATLLRVIAGHDPLDSTSMPTAVPDYAAHFRSDLKGIRVGVPKEYFIAGMQPEVEQSIRAAIEVLKSLGAEIRAVSLPHTDYALPVYYLIAPAEASANLARFDGVRYGLRIDRGELWATYKATRGAGLWRRSQTPHHDRHVCAVGGLLRRILFKGAESPHVDQVGL